MEVEVPRRWGFLAGVVGGLAMVITMLALRLVFGIPALAEVLEDRVVPFVPAPVFTFFIDRLGSFSKQLLFLSVIAGMVIVAGLGGLLYARLWGRDQIYVAGLDETIRQRAFFRAAPWRRALAAGVALWLLFGVLFQPLLGAGFFGGGLRGGPLSASISLLLSFLVFAFALETAYAVLALPAPILGEGPTVDPARRLFLRRAMLGGLAAVLGGTVLGLMAGLRRGASEAFVFRRDVEGITPEITPNDKFYVVSKNFSDPQVDVSSWKLELTGSVDHPFTATHADLRAMPATEQYQTLECISNAIGGDLISNARWKGVPLRDLLARAGLKPSVISISFYAEDGYSDSIPLAKAMEPTTLIVYEMNGTPLPTNHGAPARLLVPGLYGEKNVKWINKIQPVDYDFSGFWQQVGWSNSGTVLTNARIDVPRDGAVLALQVTPVEGIAFAGDRGIKRLEVSVDGGKNWADADLKPALSPFTWVLWSYDWQPARDGAYSIVVRASDGSGAVQTSVVTDNFPDGPTGRHAISVRILSA